MANPVAAACVLGELAALERLGCDIGQGFLLARPMAADATMRFLIERDRTPVTVPSGRTATVSPWPPPR